MVMEQVRRLKTYELPLHELHNLAPAISWSNPPAISLDLSPVKVCQIVGEWYTAHTSDVKRHEAGQFFTSPLIARYMANSAGILDDQLQVLDPGAGVGILACAI